MAAFLAALVIVFLAELGDKTQFLVMAFAARWRWTQVLAGALLATAGTHLLAVAVGGVLPRLIPLFWVKMAAGIAFLGFGVWSLWPEKGCGCSEAEEAREEAEHARLRKTVLWTVAGAFFLAEMGDKTQLATMALAAQYAAPVPVFLGAFLAMALVDGLAVAAGALLAKRIPERALKVAAGIIFILFGILTLAALTSPALAADPLRAYDELSESRWERTVEKTGTLVILWHHSQRDQPLLGGKRPSALAAAYLEELGFTPSFRADLRSFSISGEKAFAAHLSLPPALAGKLPLIVEYQEGKPTRLAWFDRDRGAFSVLPADFRDQEVGHWLKEE